MSKTDKTLEEYHAKKESYPCGSSFDMAVFAGNGDADCHRVRPSYSRRLVKKDSSICDLCIYNKKWL